MVHHLVQVVAQEQIILAAEAAVAVLHLIMQTLKLEVMAVQV